MLVALLTLLFLGGGGSTARLDFIAEAGGKVAIAVPAGERQDAALDTIEAIADRTKDRTKKVKALAKDIDNLVDTANTSPAAFDAAWQKYYAVFESYNRDVLELRYELRDQLTREEWQQVFPPLD